MPGGKSKDKKVTLPYCAKLNSTHQNDDLKTPLKQAFQAKKHFEHESETILYNEPFQCCFMPNFLKDPEFLEGLKEELLDQIFYEKNNDLYKFQQTDDFKLISTPHAKCIRDVIYEDFLGWMKDITGINLSNKVDLTCSRYDYTDVLLCHDDELDTRRVAFVLYLVPPWSAQDGGTLDVFNVDEMKQPKDIVRSLVPVWNSLVWFEVSEASHHQVSEVLNIDKSRLSVNGWFHGIPDPRPQKYIEPNVETQQYGMTGEDVVFEWINPIYLDPEVQGQVQVKFENDSEIELQGFLRDEKYQQIVEALQNKNTKWIKRGPPNKRNYEHCQRKNKPLILQQCLDFLQSEEMFLTLSNLTGLTLHQLVAENQSDTDSEADSESIAGVNAGCGERVDPDRKTPEGTTVDSTKSKRLKLDPEAQSDEDKAADGSVHEQATAADDSQKPESSRPNKKKEDVNPQCHGELRRWGHGSYTMLLDTDTDQSEYALDATLFCSCKGWQQDYGGYTSYITKGQDEELLTVNPSENSLALVYREPDTVKFVKHINHKVKDMISGPKFYDFHVVYYE